MKINYMNIPVVDENGNALASTCEIAPYLLPFIKYTQGEFKGLTLDKCPEDRLDSLKNRLNQLLLDKNIGGGLTSVALKHKSGRAFKKNLLCTETQLLDILCAFHPEIPRRGKRGAGRRWAIEDDDIQKAIDSVAHLFGKKRKIATSSTARYFPKTSAPSKPNLSGHIHNRTLFEFSHRGVPTAKMQCILLEVEGLLCKWNLESKKGELA